VIYLARHGRTAYNEEGRFQGQGPVPLDDVGLQQARELGELARGYGFRALYASPLLRTRQTAEAVAAKIGLPIQYDERLMETDTGDWTDRSFAEVRAEDPEAFDGWLQGKADFAFPGGESFVQQADRVTAALEEIERGPLPALVVCHGMAIRVALARRRGLDGPGPNAPANGSITPYDDGDGQVRPPHATDTPAS
jgi:broad specificity phosphatase PhoE